MISSTWSLIIALTAMGCAGTKEVPKGSVSGKVTVNGQPLKLGTITFCWSGGERPQVSTAHVDTDGSYKIESVNSGSCKVSIICVKPITLVGSVKKNAEKIDFPKEYTEITKKYGNLDTSGLTFEVKPGNNNTYDIDLKP